MYLWAMEQGITFFPVFADTGHEHEKTLEYVETLPEKTGGPEITTIRADFSDKFAARRQYIAENWTKERIVNFKPNKKYPEGRTQISPPVEQWRIDRAIELMHPTGNPFLDMCMLKGRFPSTKARFCTEQLKTFPMMFQVIFPAIKKAGSGCRVISLQGTRWEESTARSKLPKINRCDTGAVIHRPLLSWTHDDVFAIHKRHNIQPNPLYLEGFGRVGCFPCVMCQKGEIGEMARRYPEHVQRVAEWEQIVSSVSRRGIGTFFPDNKSIKPEGHNSERDGYYGIRAVAEWAKTDRGGLQYNLLNFTEETDTVTGCKSQNNLCE